MGTTTRLHAFKLAVAATLGAAMPEVTILTADFGRQTPSDAVTLGDTEFIRDEWSGPGHRRRDQEYRIQGSCWVQLSGGDEHVARLARERAMGLMARVEEALRTNHTVDGAVMTCQVQLVAVVEGTLPESRYCEVDFWIAVDDQLVS